MMNKFFSPIFGLIALVLIAENLGLTVSAQTPPPQTTCSGSGCAAMSQAELFIKAFGGSKGFKTLELALNEEARNAFYGIDATIVEVEKGRLSPEDGARIIENHKSHLREIIDSKTTDVMFVAVNGQVSDIPAISKHLGALLSVARQDQFAGREELAQHTQKQLMRIFNTFLQRFAETCEQQSFPVETALELEQQSEILETGISVIHCANRKFSAELNSQGVKYRFETCTNSSREAVWKLKISGRVVGEGKGYGSIWQAKVVFQDWEDDPQGTMVITDKKLEVKEESVKIPNDAGPNAKPNGRASAPVPPNQRQPQVNFLYLRMTTILLIGTRGYVADDGGPVVEAEIKREDKPCNPVTGSSFN